MTASFTLRRIDWLIVLAALGVLAAGWPLSIPPVGLVALATLFAYLAEPHLHDERAALRYDVLHSLWHAPTALAFYLLFQ